MTDAVLADPVRSGTVRTIDLRYWSYDDSGALDAPAGGRQTPARLMDRMRPSPDRLYQQVSEYRTRFPDRALVIERHLPSRQHVWAFLMGGGSMLIDKVHFPPDGAGSPLPGAGYERPVGSDIARVPSRLVTDHLGAALATSRPLRLDGQETGWCLADPGRSYLLYLPHGGRVALPLPGGAPALRCRWLDPRTGAVRDGPPVRPDPDGRVELTAPDRRDRAVWLTPLAART